MESLHPFHFCRFKFFQDALQTCFYMVFFKDTAVDSLHSG
jgi:hypothetical protein